MSTPAEPAFIASSISAAVTAILTIAQAVPNIDKRLGRVRDIEREIGNVPDLVRWLYVWPQYFYWTLLVGITAVGLLMAGSFIYGLVPGAVLPPTLKDFSSNGVYVVASWLLVGAMMYLNLITWIAIVVGKFAGSVGDPGWPALKTFVRFNENAKPLFVNKANAGALADLLIHTAPDQNPPDRAEPPTAPRAGISEFHERIGNALLAGCIIEGAHGNPGFPRRQNWKRFYRVIAAIALETDRFLPATVKKHGHEDQFCIDVLNELNWRLLKEAVDSAPEASRAARNALTKAQSDLASQQGHSASKQTLAALEAEVEAARSTEALTQAVEDALTAAQTAGTKLQAAEKEWREARQAFESAGPHHSAELKRALEAAQTKLETAQQANEDALQKADSAQRAVPKPKDIYQPLPVSIDLIDRFKRAFGGLRDDYQGKVTNLVPPKHGMIRTRMEILARRLDKLQCFQSASIRQQFIKLATVWGIWDPGTERLSVPFSKGIAALLLDRGVITTTDDVKTIAFDETHDVQVARIAQNLVIEQAILWIEPRLSSHSSWLPAAAIGSKGGKLNWWLTYELDLRMWNYQLQLHRDQEIPGDPGLTGWRASHGQVRRVKS